MKKLFVLFALVLAVSSVNAQSFSLREWKAPPKPVTAEVATETRIIPTDRAAQPNQIRPAGYIPCQVTTVRQLGNTPQGQTNPEIIQVAEHTRKGGVVVKAHTRTAPNDSKADNLGSSKKKK